MVLVKDKEQLLSAVSTGNIIVWNGKEEISDVLEEIGPLLDRYTKANLKLCKEIRFKRYITLEKANKGKFTVNALSELLKLGPFDRQDLIIVESNDISETIALIQQFINLEIDANVLTREELLKKKVIQNFFENRNHLRKLSKQLKKKVQENKSYGDLVNESKNIISTLLDSIDGEIEKTFDTTIKVAVFATKKAGKSMIVNALLGEEYAPTSQELPTPNVIVYKPHNESFLKLIYNGKEIKFESAKDLKDFIRNEFNKVKISGEKLPVMTVLYPKREGINFEVYDTPGPDLASSQHGDFIDEYIEKADVSVFAVDYTKYAQSTEIELLKKIKDSFEKKGKIYSFVCTINKLDMMYLDTDTEKIKVRVSYFMERKLRELGFKNFVVIPISAIIYFYLVKMAEYIDEIKEVKNLRTYLINLEDDEDFFEKSGIPIEIFSEINAFVGKVKQIHKIKQPTYKDILNISGFESFKRYLVYIAQEKASLEKNFYHIRAIDSYFTQIHNHISSSYALSAKDVNKLKEALDKFVKEASEEFLKKELDSFFEEVGEEFSKKRRRMLKDIFKEIEADIKAQIWERVKEIKRNLGKDIDMLKKAGISFRYKFENKYNTISLMDEQYIVEEIVEILEKKYEELYTVLESFKNGYRNRFEKTKEILKKAINSLEKELNRNFSETEEISKISIQLPELDLEFGIEEIKETIEKGIRKLEVNRIFIKSEIFGKSIKGGFFRILASIFGKDRYEIDKDLLFREIDREAEALEHKLIREIKATFFQLDDELDSIEEHFKEILKKIKKEAHVYLNSIFTPIKKLKENIYKERKEKQLLIEFLNSLINEWQVLENVWKTGIVGNYSKFKEDNSG